jgi:hypothetical protein
MPEQKFGKIIMTIEIDENGHVTKAMKPDGTELDYHPEENKRLHGTKTRLLTPNDCCWRVIGGVLRCKPEYC